MKTVKRVFSLFFVFFVKRCLAPSGALQLNPPSRSGRSLRFGPVAAGFACTLLAAFYFVLSGTARARGARSVQAQNQCSANSLQVGTLPFIHVEKAFTSITWLSSTASPIDSEDSQRVKCAGPDTLFDESNEPACFSFSGGYGGVTVVSNFSRHKISHFTLDNSPVEGAIDPMYHPMDGSLWGLLEGELPVNLEGVVASRVSVEAIYILLGSFCFVPEAGPTQTYAIEGFLLSHEELRFSVFYLEISSNWGGSHTCLARFRLHESD